jgi:hypothetical protein
MTFELMLVFPIAMAFFLAMIEFSMILTARQQLLAASREGARVAAIGADHEEVAITIRRYLGEGPLGDSELTMTDAEGSVLSTSLAVRSGEPVEVWLRVPTGHVVPDLLRFIGYSIKDDELVARTVMRRE